MKKSKETFFDKTYLAKDKDGRFHETRLSAYMREKNTIEPLNKLIRWMDEEYTDETRT